MLSYLESISSNPFAISVTAFEKAPVKAAQDVRNVRLVGIRLLLTSAVS